MKVLQINSVCGVGSTGRIATDIHKMLLEQGHESYIAYGRGEAKNCNNSIRIGNNLDVLFHVLLTRFFDMHGFGSKRATKKFIKKVKEINPDVIHLHNIHGYYINIEVLFNYLKESGKKLVWTLHDCWAFTGHCAYFDFVGCEKWKTGCEKCPQLKSYPNSIFKDHSKKNYLKKKALFNNLHNLTLVTPSQWLSNLVKTSFLKEYQVQVINNGIDLNVFKPTESDFRKKYNLEDKFIILGVASVWEMRKGLKDFIALSKLIEDNFLILIVGLSKSQSKLINDLKNIIGINKTSDMRELVQIYSISNVYFNPTYEDNYPTTNLEAIACKIPIVTYDTGGSIEILKNNTEFIVDKGNINQAYNLFKRIKSESIEFKFEDKKLNNCNINKYCNFQKYINLYLE